jgi:hypothetical protein
MSLSWGARKQIFYFAILAGAIIVAAVIVLYPHFNKEPTCFDGKMNGDEAGLDCGGACLKVCTAQAIPLVTLWARAFEVTPGKYNLLAYIENQNRESGVSAINYEFKVYDDNNIFIARASGTTFITPNDRTAIFAPGIQTGNRVPKRVSFNFTSVPTWQKVDRNQRNALTLSAENKKFTNLLSSPKLEAEISNKTLTEFKNVDVYVILYDEDDNVMNVSKTLIDILPKNGKAPVVFTWPYAFQKEPTRIDIFPQVDIFSTRIER